MGGRKGVGNHEASGYRLLAFRAGEAEEERAKLRRVRVKGTSKSAVGPRRGGGAPLRSSPHVARSTAGQKHPGPGAGHKKPCEALKAPTRGCGCTCKAGYRVGMPPSQIQTAASIMSHAGDMGPPTTRDGPDTCASYPDGPRKGNRPWAERHLMAHERF